MPTPPLAPTIKTFLSWTLVPKLYVKLLYAVPKHVANPEASLKLKKLGFLVILLSLVNPYSCKAPPLVKPKTSLQL